MNVRANQRRRRGRAAALLCLLGATVDARADSGSASGAAPGSAPRDAAFNELWTADAPLDDAPDLEDLLKQPVVTVSGGEAEERTRAPANTIVVTGDEIRRRGWRSIAAVLAEQPGFYVVDDLVNPSIGIRGASGGLRAGSRIVKVLINGTAVNFRPELTAFLGPEFIPIEAVERVEIVQGPLSALYGANAFLATVNVITLDPAVYGGTTEVSAQVGAVQGHAAGSGSLLIVQGGGKGGLTLAVMKERVDRSGLSIDRTFEGQDPAIRSFASLLGQKSREDTSTPESLFLSAFVGRPEGRWGRLSLQGGTQRQNAAAEFQVNSAMSHRSRVALANNWSVLRHQKRWSRGLSATSSLGYAWGGPTRDAKLHLPDNHNAYYTPRFSYQAITADAAVSWAPLPGRLRFRFAADFELDREQILYYRQTFLIPSGDRPAGSSEDLLYGNVDRTQNIRDAAVALQVASSPFSGALAALRVQADMRIDAIRFGPSDIPLQPSWRLGVVQPWSKGLTLKLIAGRSFQVPSSVLMFAQGGYGIANNVVGNYDARRLGVPALRPQVADGLELVATVELGSMLALDLDLFGQRVMDQIVFQQLATDFVAVNASEARAVGALAEARLKLPYVALHANVSAQVSVDSDGSLALRAQSQYPALFGVAGVEHTFRRPKLLLGARLRWAGPRAATQSNQLLNDGRRYTLPGYAMLDARASVSAPGLVDGSRSEFALSTRNVLDSRIHEPGFAGLDLPVLGRTVWFELRQAF